MAETYILMTAGRPDSLDEHLELPTPKRSEVWPVGAPVGVKHYKSGNLMALAIVECSTPGKVTVHITKRFS